MNANFLRRSIFSLLGLASLAVLSTESSAFAQTVKNTNSDGLDLGISSAQGENNPIHAQLSTPNPEDFDSTSGAISVNPSSLRSLSARALLQAKQISKEINPDNNSSEVIPVPGTVSTSSAALSSEALQQNPTKQPDRNLAQADIGVGRSTRGGSSYLGIGANIGLAGESSAVGDGNFVVISKVGITRSLSVRPSAVLGGDTVFLIPLTYDFSLNAADPFTEPLPISPYVGGGAAISTGDDSETALLITGGVDLPLNSQFTANAAVNAAFFDDTDIGLVIGVGYNFRGF